MKKSLSTLTISLATLFAFCSASFASSLKVNGKCLNENSKMVKCSISTDGNMIDIDYKAKKYSHLDTTVPAEKINRISMGEYSRRRVGESVALGILVSPLALFGLMSKKKRDTFGIEYQDAKDQPNMSFIQVKKKYGHALKTALQTSYGKEISLEESVAKK